MWTNQPKVQLLADSINPTTGTRLSTFQVEYWRPILPEMNTHRCFSRNAASSRAQRFSTRCTQVSNNPWLPKHWNAEQPGMVGVEEFDAQTKEIINEIIADLARNTVDTIELLNQVVKGRTGKEIHKQYLNRYLEPFTSTTQLITSTDWSNFFKLRLASDAQPEIKDVATEMFYQLQENNPQRTSLHIPYVTQEELEEYGEETAIKISVARCARVSYKAYSGNIKLEKDLELYQRLLESGHMSPFEHIAKPSNEAGSFFNLKDWKSVRYAIEHHIDFGSI